MAGSPRSAKVLVVDDDPVVCELVTSVLGSREHTVVAAADAAAGLRLLFAERPDLVILDVNLPDLDGWTMLERIRELGDLPVLMLTSHAQEVDKVRALRGGADDYLTKPFGRQELPARVEALLRRSHASQAGVGSPADFYVDARLTVDQRQRQVTRRGEELRLTPLEFRLLSALVRHPGQVLGADQLIEMAWRDPFVQPEQVKLYVSRLRRKLGEPAAIETVRGFGYRYLPPQD